MKEQKHTLRAALALILALAMCVSMAVPAMAARKSGGAIALDAPGMEAASPAKLADGAAL